MRVDVLGPVTIRRTDGTGAEQLVSDQALGGRRGRITLAALALAGSVVPSERLAWMIWGDDPPPTWPAALRGVVRGLRSAGAAIGAGHQDLVVTGPSGYGIAAGVRTDLGQAAADVRQAATMHAEGRHRAVLDLAGPVTRMAGDQLLPGEDASWLAPHRQEVDALALHAVQLVAESAGVLGEHRLAVETARRGVAARGLDESAHRVLIAALDRAGDRAGAVRAYEDCRSVLAEQLGIDPSAGTVAVYLAALRDQAVPVRAPVPVLASSFLGRERELEVVHAALAHPGAVTLRGRGGVGKSRLAAQAAALRGPFASAPLWVSLAAVTADALVASVVALALGVPPDTDDTAVAIADHVAPLGRALLVLDGCEGVVDGAASLVTAMTSRAPMLTVLATSRVPLSVEDERVVDVEPFPQPVLEAEAGDDGGAALRDATQMQLLADRVRESGGTLVVDGTTAADLLALCRRSAGLPLALELLAAQLVAIPAGDLHDQLYEIMPATPGDEDALRAIARAGYDLLDADEAALFRRLAVFDGPVGLPLAREVVSGGPIAAVRVVRLLRELAARGLVTVDRSGPRWRYHQDDDLRRFARDLLAEHAAERTEAFSRLADAVRARLPEDARAAPGPFRVEITDMLGSIRSLFTAALTGLADAERCRELAFRLHRYFATTDVDEGRFWLTRLLAAGAPGPWSAYATYALGYLGYWSGDTAGAMRDLESAAELLAGAADGYRARALIFLAGLLDDVDRGAEAVEHVRLAIDAAAPFDVDLQVSAAMGLGSVLAERVDPSAARYARDAIERCRRDASADQLTITLPTAAMISWQAGDLSQARAYVGEALPLHAGTMRIARVVLLSAAAGVCLADGELDRAIELGRTADEEADELGVEREVPLIRAVLARALLARGDLPDAAQCCAGALRAARSMSVEFPAAIGLETAVLIAQAAGSADEAALRDLLAAAAVVRARGDRPPPAPLAPAIDAVRLALGPRTSATPPPDTRTAVDTALGVLAAVTGRDTVGTERPGSRLLGRA